MSARRENEKYDRKEELPSSDFRIINWIGIISQLTDTKMRQLLDGTDVPPPQFILLNHFIHHPDEGKTVSGIAWAMQQPQPGITKTVAKMLAKGFLRAEDNPEDGRSKILYLTDAGIKAHAQAKERLELALADTFDGWREWEKKDFFGFLDRLKVYLDENR
ncbi:MarR family transcriptional regulator [Sneathiella chungangensis]|uniref:MarR family transcriptional regulator n=1 Tax=Sneathiella chungangensis TaxID=1418234 RepID=A0A845MIG8_9PROT|nr:MarR family transcriptional regulator [Sneathiella chungangensis]MZR23402.1 MarR family transcriptional regulator [Sneathiella chungangensis]